MKTIYLFRHSKPDKYSTMENENIPLSLEGKTLIKNLMDKLSITSGIKVFSSPYTRAVQTAEIMSHKIILDTRLTERRIGNTETFTKELWMKQYVDLDVKNDNGESFRMVQKRMQSAINDILIELTEGESVAVVSHAAAICAYLQQYCEIKVTDADTKQRRITFNNEIVHDGILSAPSCFKLSFDKELSAISYTDCIF